jgi:hypothetical protein
MINVEQTIISQYGNSATISRLIANMNEYLDPRADFDAFYDFVWNVDTAQGFGLDIWGRIVNIGRDLLLSDAELYFGFSDALPGSYPFGEQPFYDGTEPATQTYRLADDAYRTLILVKALSNISATNAPSLNQLLQNLFGDRGRVYVNDMGGMNIRYTFEFLLTGYEFAIMTQSGAIPRPAGVGATIFNTNLPVFGFSEAGTESAAPFGQAPFIQEGASYATV